VMRWLVWTEGRQVLFIRIMEDWPKGFQSCHSITEPQYRIRSTRQHHRWHWALQWIHGSLNLINCSFCLPQSYIIVITLHWWGYSVNRYSVGFDNCPCRRHSPIILMTSIWFSLCLSTVS
jgi:hypothetical protein